MIVMGWFDLLKRQRPMRTGKDRRPPANPFKGETPLESTKRIMGRGTQKPTEDRRVIFEEGKKRIPTKMIAVGAKSGRAFPSNPKVQYSCNMCGKPLPPDKRKEISYLDPDGDIRLGTFCQQCAEKIANK